MISVNTDNMAAHTPVTGVYPAAVTEALPLTVESIVASAEDAGAISVVVEASEDGHEITSTFEDLTRVVEVTPEGAFVRVFVDAAQEEKNNLRDNDESR